MRLNNIFNQLTFLTVFVVFTTNLEVSPSYQIQSHSQPRFDRFDFITASSGWVLLDQHFLWTSDAGETWNEIGPSIPSGAAVQDAQFIDANTGWILWTTDNIDGSAAFTLARTLDHGRTWEIDSLTLFEPGDASSHIERASLGWLDEQTGWIAVKQATGSNFSMGALFRTFDGGVTWTRSTLPVADHVSFSDFQIGWAVGNPGSGRIFKTKDGGVTWQSTMPDFPSGSLVDIYEPFYTDGKGALVATRLGTSSRLEVYMEEDPADEWLLLGQVFLDADPGVIGFSAIDADNLIVTIPGSRSIVRLKDGILNVLENQDGLSGSIVELDMVSMDVGWAKSMESNCISGSSSDGGTAVSCTSQPRLLRTDDGGITWQDIKLPVVVSTVNSPSAIESSQIITTTTVPGIGNTELFVGQGFDKCEIPTAPQLQTWWNNGPYQAVNLYIGGSSRACANTAITAGYLQQLHQQGWRFIPTWVGPQAPCTGYISRFSSDVVVAYDQGVNEADLAVDRLVELGLTYPDGTGSVVYYDIEYYGTDTACRDAVNSFMSGWVSQIKARGNLAGVYGSTLCNTGLSDFRGITNVPDIIWPARWYHNLGEGYYDPAATVWNLGNCVPNTVWANHQRIRQYEGDHNETWGDLTLGIDSNVLDGVVAIPYNPPSVTNITRRNTDPTNAATVDFNVLFSASVTGFGVGDLKLTTSGVSGAAINSVSGAGNEYVVKVATGSGNGTIRLDIVDDDTVIDGVGGRLGGAGLGNGNFSNSEIYTVIKITTFGDVPVTHPHYDNIEILYANGYTGGCQTSPLLFCPEMVMSRAQSAVFMLRGNFDGGYVPVEPTHFFLDNWKKSSWGEGWAESMYLEGLTAGCSPAPLKFCPDDVLTNVQLAVFGLRLKYGMSYMPPQGTGMVFADMTNPGFWGSGWAEQAYLDGLIPACGTSGGKPLFCPNALVNRGFGASVIVAAKNLSMP